MTKRFFVFLVLTIGLISCGSMTFAQDDPESAETAIVDVADPAEHFVVTYFHGDRRCATCNKLESYSKEAIEAEFETALADSSVIFRTVNYDDEDNKHYIKEYALYTKALIISKVNSEGEQAWRNLDKIWELVGDKDAYLTYVREGARDFVAGKSK